MSIVLTVETNVGNTKIGKDIVGVFNKKPTQQALDNAVLKSFGPIERIDTIHLLKFNRYEYETQIASVVFELEEIIDFDEDL